MTVLSSALNQPRELSRRADAMPRSAIREIMALAAARSDVIHLEVGEPDFGTPDHIVRPPSRRFARARPNTPAMPAGRNCANGSPRACANAPAPP